MRGYELFAKELGSAQICGSYLRKSGEKQDLLSFEVATNSG
jgi:hypothetical protein